ncbi:hypothetical protein GCM10028808_73360 [Spirosoma migulaei]
MWIILAQIICVAAAIGALAIYYVLDDKTPGTVRYGLLGLAASFIGVTGASVNNPAVYEHAAAIAFSVVAIMVLVIVAYLVIANQIDVVVIKVSGGAFAVVVMLWLIGSCSDTKRQELQLKDAATPVGSSTITIGDSTAQAATDFLKRSEK